MPLGSGLSGGGIYSTCCVTSTGVSALVVSGNDLYVGGSFTAAGGKVSPFLARAYLLDLPALSVRRSDAEVKVSWPSVDTTGFALEQADGLTVAANWNVNSATVTDDGVKKSVLLPATTRAQFFRLRR